MTIRRPPPETWPPGSTHDQRPGSAAEPGQHVVLALGSNLGDRLATLQGGVDASCSAPPGLTLVALSPVYETVPVGGPPQPEYLNAVLIAGHRLSAAGLLHRCQRRSGVRADPRQRSGVRGRWTWMSSFTVTW